VRGATRQPFTGFGPCMGVLKLAARCCFCLLERFLEGLELFSETMCKTVGQFGLHFGNIILPMASFSSSTSTTFYRRIRYLT
jgi:hypothetical protein